ncbi:uncharacterized protein LOC134831807 [Culicoides brevitarsis]|uniref:uncharacterized protein LOC134831807 n=1 Tax=Culicoides brevitarsis TaxID=469753 RepID=UPI00307C1FFB
MSANETILVDEAEILDLINEANTAVDKLNFVTLTEDYEKKCQIIFAELDKDLTNWSKNITKYIEKLREAQQLEEGVKYDLIQRLSLNSGSISDEIKTFEGRLKQLETILRENGKVVCGELVSNEELALVQKLEDEVDLINDLLTDTNKDFSEVAGEYKEGVKCAKVLGRAQKLLDGIDGLESQLNKIQRKIIKNGVKKIQIEEI